MAAMDGHHADETVRMNDLSRDRRRRTRSRSQAERWLPRVDIGMRSDPLARIKIDSTDWSDARSDSTSARSRVVSPVPNLQAGHCPQDSSYRKP
jgi:hypothetical protein